MVGQNVGKVLLFAALWTGFHFLKFFQHISEFLIVTYFFIHVYVTNSTISTMTSSLFTTKLCTVVSQVTMESHFWHVLTNIVKQTSESKLAKTTGSYNSVFELSAYTFVTKRSVK